MTERLGQQGAVLLPAGEHDRLAGGQPVGQERHDRGRQVLGGAVEERGVQVGWSGGGGQRSLPTRCMPGSSSTSSMRIVNSTGGCGATSRTWPPDDR